MYIDRSTLDSGVCRLLPVAPNSIVDKIIDEVDDREDILSLAMTCRSLNDLLIPDHLDYRQLELGIGAVAVWMHLVNEPSLARNVRHLYIADADLDRYPRCIEEPYGLPNPPLRDRLKSELTLCRALRNMPLLNSFRWTENAGAPESGNKLWTTLRRFCPLLRSVDVTDDEPRKYNLGYHPEQDNTGSSDEENFGVTLEGQAISSLRIMRSEIFNLNHLTTFKIWVNKGDDSLYPSEALVNNLKRFLLLSTQIHELHLRFPADIGNLAFDSILSNLRLHNLRHVVFHGISSGSDAARSFFVNHPTIEQLSIIPNEEPIAFNLDGIKGLPVFPNLRIYTGTWYSILVLATVKPPILQELCDLYSWWSVNSKGVSKEQLVEALNLLSSGTLFNVELAFNPLLRDDGERLLWEEEICRAVPNAVVIFS